MYKLGFIGGGINSAIGRTHFTASVMDHKFEVVAGCFSRSEEMNQKTAQEYAVEPSRVYGDYKKMLQKEQGNLDAVVVLVPTNNHTEIVQACLDMHYPVICEKSLALSVAECESIIDKVEQTKGFCCVTYNYTGYPMIHYLRNEIRKGTLGKLIRIVIEMPQESFIRQSVEGKKPTPQEWRLSDYAVPTISLDLGSHLHNMVGFLTGQKPKQVIAQENSYGFFHDIIDDVSCMIDYTDDLTVQMWYSKAALGNRNGLCVRVYGEEGSASWYQMEPEKLTICDKSGKVHLIDRSNLTAEDTFYERFKPGHPSGFIEAFANYYQEIYKMLESYKKNGRMESDYIMDLESSKEGLQLFEAVHKSSKTKKWEEVK